MDTHEIVPRPDGRFYRARKKPHAEILGDEWDGVSVIVWRTHDIDVATALAGQAWARYVDSREPLPGNGETGWWKSVPWDAHGSGCDGTVIGVSHSERGAVPAVMFL